jgi:hypothetical protein
VRWQRSLKNKPFRVHRRYPRHPAFLSGLSLEFSFGIEVSGVRCRRAVLEKDLLEILLRLLNTEPLKKAN